MNTHTTSPAIKNLLLIVLASAGLSFAHVALAAEHGGEKMGGAADSQMSPEGSMNQNSQMMPDATQGLDRAQERMSPMGMEHEKATEQATEQETNAKKSAKTKKDKKPLARE